MLFRSNDKIISLVRNKKLYQADGKELSGGQLIQYIEMFGEDDLDINETKWGKYAYLQEFPDASDWSDEKVMSFVELLNLDLYFITKL